MSLINEMLKDLEKRRSRDLETSPSLRDNITWETKPNQKSLDWLSVAIVFTLVLLLSVIAYLLWERSLAKNEVFAKKNTQAVPALTVINQDAKNKAVKSQRDNIKKPAVIKIAKNNIKKPAVIKKVKNNIKKPVKTNLTAAKKYVQVADIDDVDNSPEQTIKKKHRPLSSQQLAELAYKKGYQFLQQGRMRKGKESLREALSLYSLHTKAREMLAGIYIKSGRFIYAAELLKEGVNVSPEYPLFAKLYARVLLEQNNPLLAIKILKQGASFATMEVKPDYYALLAATYQRVKDHEKAVGIYLQLVKLRPSAGIWWLGLAISLEKLTKNKEALEAYQRAQKTGSLKMGLVKFTNNRVSALQEIGFPEK